MILERWQGTVVVTHQEGDWNPHSRLRNALVGEIGSVMQQFTNWSIRQRKDNQPSPDLPAYFIWTRPPLSK